MSKRTPPHITQLQAEGTKMERDLIKEEIHLGARKLADKMPRSAPERQVYIRNVVQRTLRGELDLEVVKVFIKMTNSYMELQSCIPRARLTLRR